MTYRLFPYQEVGAAFLAARKAALLADEPGLGKTAQAIIGAMKACAAEEISPTIGVICPASVRSVWAREFGRWWPQNYVAELIVESYESAQKKEWPHLDVLIIDEVHYCKSKDAKRTKFVFDLAQRATHVYALSGTPTPNHSAELWPMLRALAPETILGANGKPMSYWQFVMKFCKTKDNGFGIQIIGNKNSRHLKERIRPFYLRRRKEEVLKELPPIRFDTLPISGASVAGYNDALADALAACETDDEVVAALKKAAPHVAALRRLTGLAKVPGVVEWVKDWFEGGGSKLVLFAHHRDVIEALRSELHSWLFKQEKALAVLDGSSTAKEREDWVMRFQHHKDVVLFIGQIQAAGTGITLTASSDVLFVESSWVPAENQQAAMRIHRIGQKNACTVRFATLAGSIDERIQAVVARKTEEIAEVFG